MLSYFATGSLSWCGLLSFIDALGAFGLLFWGDSLTDIGLLLLTGTLLLLGLLSERFNDYYKIHF